MMRLVFKKISQFLEKFFTTITLHLMYYLAIGPTALVAKLVGKKFLQDNQNPNSNWRLKNKVDSKKNLTKMY